MIRTTNKKDAFRVVACDNLGTVQGLTRDRTWDVVHTVDGCQLVVGSFTTREEARDEARRRNRSAKRR